MRSAIASRTRNSTGFGPYRRAGRLKFEMLEPRMLLTGSIQGLKWLDLDVDGQHDSDEAGIPEWTIYLQGSHDGVQDGDRWVTQTDKNGEYLFADLPDGTYTVSEELPDGWTQTFPGPRAELRDIRTYPVGEGAAMDFRFTSAAVMDYADTDPAWGANRLPVDVTVEVVWPDWCWSVQPDRTLVSVEGDQIDISVFGQNAEICPLIPGPKIERHTVSLPPLEPGKYSMAATLYEDNIYLMRPAPAPSLGTSATMLLSAVGTHIVEVPGDPTFAPRHFDFGNIRLHEQRGPHIISHYPSGQIPHPVHEVSVTFNQPIDPKTFTPEDVHVTIGFLDVYVPVFDVRAVDAVTFLIEFGGPDMVLDYHVWVGPHIENPAGIEMDQDRDGRPGEPDDDVYDAGFVVVEPIAPRVVDQWPAPDTTEWLVSFVQVTFNEPMDPATINEDTFWVAGNVDDDVLLADVSAEMRIPGEVSYDETTFTAIFTPYLERLPQGTYVVVAEDAITDRHGISLDGEWSGRFPSGNGQPGGHYLTLFEVSEVSMIQGAKWHDRNGNGTWDDDESGLPRWTIYLDEDRDGQFDPPTHGFAEVIEADEYRVGEPIVDPSGIATLHEVSGGLPILAVPNKYVNTVQNVFGTGGDRAVEFRDTWSETEAVLGVRFAQPVSRVSLEFAGTGLRGGYQGIMRAFDAAGNLLVDARTEVIWGSGSETLTISVPGNKIAYLEATGSSRWIPLMIDHLEYSAVEQPGEPHTETDLHGHYAFEGLLPGTYAVGEVLQKGWRQTYPRREAELVETSSRQVGDGGALDFAISEVTISPDHTDPFGVDITLEVLWQDTSYALVPDATYVSVEDGLIEIELLGESSGVGLDVLWTESTTIHVPELKPGRYAILATLNESAGPMLPAFWPIWEAEGTMIVSPGQQHLVTVEAGEIVRDVDFGNRPIPRVNGRHVFYNNSGFDDAAQGLSSNDAIAPDPETAADPSLGKTALLPSQTATFQNYTSYSRGINGIMVDIAGLANPDELDLENLGHYFEFQVGNSDDLNDWGPAPAPSSVAVRESPDAENAKRVTIIWEDYAIRNQWLQVTVLGDADYTGLTNPDVFYFGNAVGDSGNSDTDAIVDETDVALARDNPHNFFNPATITCPYDYNHDGRVNATDMLIAQSNQTDSETALKLIHPPVLEGESAWAEESPALASLQRDPAPTAADPSTSLGKWSWLYEFEQISMQTRPSEKHNPAAEAVDKLLATYWP